MADVQWFYAQGGQQAGPVPLEQLLQMVASGQLSPADLVWREGMVNWQPLGSLPEFGAPPAPPASPAAPYGQPYGAPGMPYQGPMPYGTASPQSYGGMAIGGFVCSLLGLLCLGPVLGIVAIILGAVALGGMNKTGNLQGRGMAIASIVIGVIDIVSSIGILVFFHRHPEASPFFHMRRF